MADTTKQEELKQKLHSFFEKRLNDLTTKFQADIDSLEKIKYEYFDTVIMKYREIDEEHKKQESEEKEKEKPEKKSDEPKQSTIEKKKIDPLNRPKSNAVTTRRPKVKEEKPQDKTEINKEKKETKQKPAIPRAATAKTATKKPATAKADQKSKTSTTNKGAANTKNVSKLDVVKQKILDLDPKFLKSLGKPNVPTSIKFYFECCGIIMNKRLAIPDNFGELELNKDTKVRYYSPLGWTTMISYIKSNSYGSFFDTIKEFQEKLYNNKLNINDETLELLRPFLDSKTCMYEPLFSDDVAMRIGGDACKRLAAFCRTISDYVYATRDATFTQKNA